MKYEAYKPIARTVVREVVAPVSREDEEFWRANRTTEGIAAGLHARIMSVRASKAFAAGWRMWGATLAARDWRR